MRIPVQSLHSGDLNIDEELRLCVYVAEVARQCELASLAAQSALFMGVATDNPRDPLVWNQVQACLTASIIVSRLLWPQVQESKKPKKQALYRIAQRRAKLLREGLEEPDDSPIHTINFIRNAFEHIDERLDAFMDGGAVSIADFYIAHEAIFRTPDDAATIERPNGAGVRIFIPTAGLLHYDNTVVDVFLLDCHLRDLRRRALAFRFDGTGHRFLHGGLLLQQIGQEWSQLRWESWRKARDKIGDPVPGD